MARRIEAKGGVPEGGAARHGEARHGDDFALSNRRVVSLGQPPQPLRRRARRPRSLGCGDDSVDGLDGGGNGGGGLGGAAVASSLSQRHSAAPPPPLAVATRCPQHTKMHFDLIFSKDLPVPIVGIS